MRGPSCFSRSCLNWINGSVGNPCRRDLPNRFLVVRERALLRDPAHRDGLSRHARRVVVSPARSYAAAIRVVNTASEHFGQPSAWGPNLQTSTLRRMVGYPIYYLDVVTKSEQDS